MTAPTGGNDEIIRVVYEAVADFSQLIRETRRAREQAAALKRDIQSLGATTTARIRVEADTSRARADLAGLVRDAVIRARVVLEAAAARSELANLVRDVIIRARVVVDSAAAKAEIRNATRDATVRVRIDTDAAGLARLAAQLAQIRDLIVHVSVRADTAALSALRAQLARLRDLVVNVRVQADTAGLQNLRSQLGRLRDLTVRVSVDLDEAGITARVRALLAHLESLGPLVIAVAVDQGDLDAFEDRLRRLRADAGGGDSGGDGPRKPAPAKPKAGKADDLLPDGLKAAAGLISTFLGLAALAVPAALAVAGAVGVISASLLAAGAGAGIFALAAAGAFAKVAAAVQAYEKSGTIADGPLMAVVRQVEAVKERYKELQKATQGDVFAVFSRGLGIAVDLLDKVQDLVGRAAQAIDGALGQVQTAINGAGFDDFLSFVDDEGPHAIAGFTTGLLGFVGGLGRLVMAFKPFVSAFIDGFAAAGQAFDKWASGLGSNTKFQHFLDYAIGHIPDLIEFLKNLFTAAGNIIVALEPIGAVLFDIANKALAVIAALPPGALTAVLTVILALAVAVKAFQAALAVQNGYRAFTKFLDDLGKKSKGAKGGLSDLLGGVGGKLGILGLAFVALNGPMDDYAEKQQAAADAAKAHADAVSDLAQKIVDAKGKVAGSDIRQATYDTLSGYQFQADVLDANDPNNTRNRGQGNDSPNAGKKITAKMDLPAAAQYAGVNLYDLTSGATGKDDAAYTRALAQFDKYIDERKKRLAELLKDPAGNRQQISQVEADLKIVGDARDAYKQLGGSQGSVAGQTQALTDAQTRQNTAVGALTDATGGLTDATGASGDAAAGAAQKYGSQAQAAEAVKAALKADFSSNVDVAAYDTAVSAMQDLDSATQSYTDAVDAQEAALRRVKDAEEAVTAARAAAVQRIKDVQRALRDQSLDQRQVVLNDKKAKENLNEVIAHGGSADDIEQARIDAEQAANALADFRQDKKPKSDALNAELAKGVEGNKALRDALQAQKDAGKALDAARRTVTQAADRVREAKVAFNQAAGAIGKTADQLRGLKTKMDTLKDKTLNLVLNAHGAEAKLAALLQGQYAIQLLAKNPNLSLADALAQAKTLVPTVADAAKTPLPSLDSGNLNPNVNPGAGATAPDSGNLNPNVRGRADGGPLTPSPVIAGPVHGPGTPTSDSILARLPVGGPVRLSRGEHVVTDAEVQRAPGGHSYLEAFRAGLRAGRPWAPVGPGLRAGGPATVPAPRLPVFAMPGLPTALPGYAAGGAANAYRAAGDTYLDRSVTVNVGTITNATPETASDSLYRQVRKAVDGDY